MNDVGFGLITTAMAIGGIVGTFSYGALERRFSLADIMRVGLLIETGTHLVLALTTLPAVALVTFTVFGAHAFVWDTTSTAVRQRAVPDELLGRVTGVYHVGVFAGSWSGRRSAACSPESSGSPRRSGSGSSARRSSWPSCGASSTTSPTPATRTPRRSRPRRRHRPRGSRVDPSALPARPLQGARHTSGVAGAIPDVS